MEIRNLGDASKADLRWKFIVLSTYIRKNKENMVYNMEYHPALKREENPAICMELPGEHNTKWKKSDSER